MRALAVSMVLAAGRSQAAGLGYMVAHPTAMPRDFLNIVDCLVPELRRRCRFRDAYEGRTLRQNLATA
jgi:hypothetical protein